MSLLEKLLVYLALISGVLLALIHKAGLDDFANGNPGRGVVYLLITIATALGWILPLIPRFRIKTETLGRLVTLAILLLWLYKTIQHYVAPDLPPL